MTRAAPQDKEMPDGVVEGQALTREKVHAGRIGQTPRHQQLDRRPRDGEGHRNDGDENDPAEEDVERNAQRSHPVQYIHRPDADHRDPPHRAEDAPPPAAPQGHEQERRVRSRDEQEDGHVIHLVHGALEGSVRNRVVERGSAVQHNEAGSVDAVAHDAPRIPARARGHDEDHKDGNAQSEARKVREGVQSFFAGGLGAGHDESVAVLEYV